MTVLSDLTTFPPPFRLPVPLTNTTLTVLPSPGEISEGDRLYLICGVSGTPPVTFKWYREGREQPLHTTTSNDNNTDYQVSPLSKGHSGRYYCEAVNYANNAIQSERVTVEGETGGRDPTYSRLAVL